MNIFVYGTLLFKPVMDLVVEEEFNAEKACLYNYTRNCIIGRVYPGIVQHMPGKVDGLLYYEVTQEAMQRLDYFEGVEYERKTVQVKSIEGQLVYADTYIVNSDHISEVEEKQWDAVYFQQVYLVDYLQHVRVIMADY